MDAFAVERYRFLLAALAVALVLGFLVAAFVARRVAQSPDDGAAASPAQILPHFMLMLVALIAGAGVVLLLPVVMILRYFPGGPVRVLVLSALMLVLAPLAYAWRSRPH